MGKLISLMMLISEHKWAVLKPFLFCTGLILLNGCSQLNRDEVVFFAPYYGFCEDELEEHLSLKLLNRTSFEVIPFFELAVSRGVQGPTGLLRVTTSDHLETVETVVLVTCFPTGRVSTKLQYGSFESMNSSKDAFGVDTSKYFGFFIVDDRLHLNFFKVDRGSILFE